MNKRILLLAIGLLLPVFALAATFTEISEDLDAVYDDLSTELSDVYTDSLDYYDELLKELEAEKYENLSKIEDIDTKSLKALISDSYINLKTNIYSRKSELELDIQVLKEKEQYALISSGDLEDQMDALEIDVTSYESKYTTQINNLRKDLVASVDDFQSDLDDLIEERADDLKDVSDFDDKFEEISYNYDLLNDYYDDLENITSISEKIIDQNGDAIKAEILELLEDRLEEKYEKYLDKDSDFVYFEQDYISKKKRMKDYMEGQINTFWLEQMEDIYEGVDMDEIEDMYIEIKAYNYDYESLLEDYDDVMGDVSDLEEVLDDSLGKFEDRIESYEDEDGELNKTAIRAAIQNDTINYFEEVFEEVKDEMDTFFESSYEILIYRKQVEQKEFNKLQVEYNSALLDKKEEEIVALKEELSSFKENTAISQSVIESNQRMLWKLELALIDGKILDLGLTKYFDKYGDLSEIVHEFLLAKKAEYTEDGKEDKFDEKIDNAYAKLLILEEDLTNNRTSFYLLMIKKGIILYYMD